MSAAASLDLRAPVRAFVVVAQVHGLDHLEDERGPETALALLRKLPNQIEDHGACDIGALTDGAWAVFPHDALPIEAALAWAAAPAAVGIARGTVSLWRGAIQGPAARAALGLARAVRLREVVLPTQLLDGVSLPVGVGAFAAPGPLGPPALALTLVRDYR